MTPPGETILLTLRLPGTLPAIATRALKADLRQAQVVGLDYHRAQKAFLPSSTPPLTARPVAHSISKTKSWPKPWPAKS